MADSFFLHSPLFRGTAAVMRNRRDVFDGAHFNARRGESAHGRFPARTGTADPNFHYPQSAFSRFVGGREGRLLGGERRAFTRPAETERSGARPGNGVAFLIGDSHDGVVEGGLDMHDAHMDDALLLLFKAFLLAGFYWCFRHMISDRSLRLGRGLLLVGNGAAARSFARTGVGMRALSANRQPAAMPQPAVRTHLDVPLDVHRDFFAEVAFDGALFFQNRTDLIDFVFRQVANLLIEIDSRAVKQGLGTGTADTVDVSEPDLSPFPRRQIHTG